MNVKPLVRSVIWLSATALLSTGWQIGCIPPDASDSPVLTLDGDHAESTVVTPHLLAPISAGQNLIWCATFQLAWDQLCNIAGGDVHLFPPEDAMVGMLDTHPILAADLDPDSYLAVAGRVKDGIYSRIEKMMQYKFSNSGPAKLKPTPGEATQPDNMVAYCYLFKKLDFPVPFERLENPLDFAGTKLASFGMEQNKPGHEKMATQVSILDYRSSDDFVIELKTRSPMDHLILSKIQPGKTLDETIANVQARRDQPSPITANPTDILSIPKMNFDITHSFPELKGKQIVLPLATALGDQEISQIVQNIRFLMDEKGVTLVSETKMETIGCSAEVTPIPRHVMVFDKPFLLMMSREGGKHPYFAMWVDNPDLLVKAAQ